MPRVGLAGREYGSGSSRDWAAKGPALLGVRAVLAESYERIHRSNLIGMGVLPLQIDGGVTLGDVWDDDDATAHLGITIPGFPNLFPLSGPNTTLAHNSIILMIECQVRHVLACLEQLRERGRTAIEPTVAAAEARPRGFSAGVRVRAARVATLRAVVVAAAFVLASCSKPSPAALKPLEGSWQGRVTIEGRNLDIVVHFKADGSGTIDIPSEQASGLSLEKISFKPPNVAFDLQAGSDVATFRGRLSGDTIDGKFQQAGHKGTFSIVKPNAGTATSVSAAGDIPVVLRTPTGDLHGSLAMPKGKGPFPVVLIISGSGNMDRNGNMPSAHLANNALLVLPKPLKEQGIACARYANRGVGASGAAPASSHSGTCPRDSSSVPWCS